MFTEVIYNRNSQYIKYLEELGLVDEGDEERIYDLPKGPYSQKEEDLLFPKAGSKDRVPAKLREKLMDRIDKWKISMCIFWKIDWFLRASSEMGESAAKNQYSLGRQITYLMTLGFALSVGTAFMLDTLGLVTLSACLLAFCLSFLGINIFDKMTWTAELVSESLCRRNSENLLAKSLKIVKFLRNWESLTTVLGLSSDRILIGAKIDRESINYRSIFQNKKLTCERLREMTLFSLNQLIERLLPIIFFLGQGLRSSSPQGNFSVEEKEEVYSFYIKGQKCREKEESILIPDIVKAIDVYTDMREYSFDLFQLLCKKTSSKSLVLTKAVKQLYDFKNEEKIAEDGFQAELQYSKTKIIKAIEINPTRNSPAGGVLYNQSCNLTRETIKLRGLLLVLSKLLRRDKKELDIAQLGFLVRESENLVALISGSFEKFSERLRSDIIEENKRRLDERNKAVCKQAEVQNTFLDNSPQEDDFIKPKLIEEQRHLKIFELEPCEEELEYQKRLFPENRKYARVKPSSLSPESEFMMKELKTILSLKNENIVSETIKVQHEGAKLRNMKDLMREMAEEKKAFVNEAKGSLLSELFQMKKASHDSEDLVLGD